MSITRSAHFRHAPRLSCDQELLNLRRGRPIGPCGAGAQQASGSRRRTTGGGMSVVLDAIKQRRRRFQRVVRWPCWPLLTQPGPVIGYVLSIDAAYLALAGWEVARTSPRARDMVLFATLMACGALCVEATRRLGQPAGVSRDLLSAWWLPVALLLPPGYAIAAPAILGGVLYLRIPRTPVYRRVFSSAALGLAGAVTSMLYQSLPTDRGGVLRPHQVVV